MSSSIRSALEARCTCVPPDSRSTLTTASLRSGAPPMNAAVEPSTTSESILVHGNGTGTIAPSGFESAQAPCAVAAPRAHRTPATVEPERRRSELPQRLAELVAGAVHAAEITASPPVQIPPPLRIDHAPQGAVGRPCGLKRGAPRAAHDSNRRAGHSVLVEIGQPQRRRIPGHVRLIPREPREPPPVRTRRRAPRRSHAPRQARAPIHRRWKSRPRSFTGSAPSPCVSRTASRRDRPRIDGQVREPGPDPRRSAASARATPACAYTRPST